MAVSSYSLYPDFRLQRRQACSISCCCAFFRRGRFLRRALICAATVDLVYISVELIFLVLSAVLVVCSRLCLCPSCRLDSDLPKSFHIMRHLAIRFFPQILICLTTDYVAFSVDCSLALVLLLALNGFPIFHLQLFLCLLPAIHTFLVVDKKDTLVLHFFLKGFLNLLPISFSLMAYCFQYEVLFLFLPSH